jgi:hypothetical protein
MCFSKNSKYKNLCSTHLVVNVLIKSTLILLFFKKTKYKKKIKLNKGTKCEKKEVEGLNYFWVNLVTKFAWRPSN